MMEVDGLTVRLHGTFEFTDAGRAWLASALSGGTVAEWQVSHDGQYWRTHRPRLTHRQRINRARALRAAR